MAAVVTLTVAAVVTLTVASVVTLTIMTGICVNYTKSSLFVELNILRIAMINYYKVIHQIKKLVTTLSSVE